MSKSFNEWFFDAWEKEKGLVTTMTASKIIGVSDVAITKAVKAEKINSYVYEKTKLLSLADVMFYKAQRESK